MFKFLNDDVHNHNKLFNYNKILINLLKLSIDLKKNEFNYFPKLCLQKLSKFDKSKSEIQSYLKELFFNDINYLYLDLELMSEEISSINEIKLLIEQMSNIKDSIKLEKSDQLINLRWYNLSNYDNSKNIDKTNHTATKNTDLGIIKKPFLLNFYDELFDFFVFIIKVLEMNLINNLDNNLNLLINFNQIWYYYSKLIITWEELLTPINKIITANFKEKFKELPQYPKFNYFKSLIKLFYKNIFLNYKKNLTSAFFKLLKIKRENIIKGINDNTYNEVLENYIIFLEDISFNEVNINFNCYSKLEVGNELEEFKNLLIKKSIKFIENNFEKMEINPKLINQYFKIELSFISEIACEKIYWEYTESIGKNILMNIRKRLKYIVNNSIKEDNEDNNSETDSNSSNSQEEKNKFIMNILLKKNSSEFFYKNDFNKFLTQKSSIFGSNISSLEVDKINLNEIFNYNIENFKVLIEEYKNLEKLCDNIILKMKENDYLLLEFNKKRGIPLELNELKQIYDICSDFDIKKNYKFNFEEIINDDITVNDFDNSLNTNEFKENEANNFKLPGYEEIVDSESSFEELKL